MGRQRASSGSGNDIMSEGTQSPSGPLQKKLAACDSFRERELSLYHYTSLPVQLED